MLHFAWPMAWACLSQPCLFAEAESFELDEWGSLDEIARLESAALAAVDVVSPMAGVGRGGGGGREGLEPGSQVLLSHMNSE